MPLLWLSLAFLTGVALSEYLRLPAGTWLALASMALVAPLLQRFWRRFIAGSPGLNLWIARLGGVSLSRLRLPLPWWAILAALALGGARFQLGLPDLNAPGMIASYNGREERLIIEAVVVAPPDQRDTYTNLRLEVERLRPEGEELFVPAHGLLLARLSAAVDWRYGDRLLLEGWLETPPEFEGFSYRDYLARQGIYAYMSSASAERLATGGGNPILRGIYALRERALELVHRLYPDPEASLLAGILLGVETGIPQEVQRAFADTGTAHIIAISGFNITILSGLFTVVFIRLLGKGRRYLAAVLSAVAIALYTLLVGAGAAVVRAAIMGGLTLLARQIGRRQQGLNSLGFVAALMTLHNPHVLWDISFQLSFTATLGLVLYAEPLTAFFRGFAARHLPSETVERLAGAFGEYFLFTIAAQVTTLPVIVYHFERLSLSSLAANPAILPVQPMVMVLGGLAVLLGLAYLPLGQGLGYLAWPFVAYTIRAVEVFARIPGGVLVLGEIALFWVALFYCLLLGWTFAGSKIREWLASRRASPQAEGDDQVGGLTYWHWAGLLAATILAAVVWRAALAAPDGCLHLTVLDVGSGDGLLIQTPEGRYLLVDGGPSPSRLSDALGRRLPLFHRKLDFLVVAAAGEGQIGALPRVLERYPPEQVLWAGPTHGSYPARTLQNSLVEMSLQSTMLEKGQRLALGGGAYLEAAAVGKRGAVLLLAWGNFRALLPVGLDFEMLEELSADAELTQVSALLLAESGYAPANPAEWIERLRPQVVLLSVAADDRDGLPSPETLEAVQGYTLLRTDRNGWIELTTDEEQMWVEVERR